MPPCFRYEEADYKLVAVKCNYIATVRVITNFLLSRQCKRLTAHTMLFVYLPSMFIHMSLFIIPLFVQVYHEWDDRFYFFMILCLHDAFKT